jgi:hypothetical protein
MRRGPSQQGADPSLRLGDLTLHELHYQTGVATRQPLAASGLSRRLTAMPAPFEGIKSEPGRAHPWHAGTRWFVNLVGAGNVIGLTFCRDACHAGDIQP